MGNVAAPDFPPISVYLYLSLDLSDRVFCYNRLLLIPCVTVSVTFADYDDA